MTIQEKLLFLSENGVSISFIAKMAHCSVQTITQWIKGNRNVSYRMERDIIAATQSYLEKIREVM